MILEVINAEFKYEDTDRRIFHSINLSVIPGDVFCILGPNGVGKTSLLKCIAGLADLTRGSIQCQGNDLLRNGRLELAKKIAYVPQIHYPVFAYSVFEAVLMGRTPYLGFFAFPDPEDEQLARKAIATLGIEHISDKPYTQISGGERQLVMFARALAQEPDIIILDEPTSHLDYGNQVKILSLIQHLSKDHGTSVIMTSHNPDHAFMIADQVAIMFDQNILGSDTPDKMITEKSLSMIYGITVRLKKDDVFGKVCVPQLIDKSVE